MTTLLVLGGHIGLDVILGWSLLSFFHNSRNRPETLLASFLVGIYAETLFVATLMFLGLSLAAAALITAAAIAGLGVAAIYRNGLHYRRPAIERLMWYEWLLLVAVGEKVAFSVWQLARTYTYFDDALRHWSGRARSLFGEVNWSLDPASPLFMGGYIGNNGYPLLTIVWRALSAKLNGEWNEVVSRADGLIFFLVVLGTIWLTVWRFSRLRWVAAAAAFVVSALPLHAWHAAAGYNDIVLEAFLLAAVAALIREEWLLAGLLAAGAAWSKNDGLLLYFPSLAATVAALQIRETGRFKWQNVVRFFLGFATIAPWLLFNYIHALGVTAGQGATAWHPDAFGLLWQKVMWGPTNSILWIVILAGVLYACRAMVKDRTGRGLMMALSIPVATILFVFTSTSAYQYLNDDSTIHRVMLQFSGMAVLVTTYGIWLKVRSADLLKAALAAKIHKTKTSRRLQ